MSIGTFLSGGIDSSLITALLQNQSSKKVKTYTIGFVEDNFNGIKAALDSGANLLKVASVDEVNHINVMKRIDELNKSL